MWYEKDFDFEPEGAYADVSAHRRGELQVDLLGQWEKVCEHVGGFTAFNCDVTAALQAGQRIL